MTGAAPHGDPIDEGDRVDEEQLAEIFMLLDHEAPDELVKVCDLFRFGMPERFGEIDAALAEGRFDDACRASHSLRGSAGAFGARRLSDLGQRLEDRCRDSDTPSAEQILTEIRAEFLLFRGILDTRLAALQAAR